jgi:hypothetical protein
MVWKKKFDAERAAEMNAKTGAAAAVASGAESKVVKIVCEKQTEIDFMLCCYMLSSIQPTGKQLFLSNRAGLEEALIALTEKDDHATEEIAEALRQARLGKSAEGRDQEASAGGGGEDEVDFDASLYLQEGMDDGDLGEDEDFDLDDEDLDDDDDDDDDYELEDEN